MVDDSVSSPKDQKLAVKRAQQASDWIRSLPHYQRWRLELIQRVEERWPKGGAKSHLGSAQQEFDRGVRWLLESLDIDKTWGAWVAADLASELSGDLKEYLDILGQGGDRVIRRGLFVPPDDLIPVETYLGPVTRVHKDGSVSRRYPPHHRISRRVRKEEMADFRAQTTFTDKFIASIADPRERAYNTLARVKSEHARDSLFYRWYEFKGWPWGRCWITSSAPLLSAARLIASTSSRRSIRPKPTFSRAVNA